MVNFEAKAHTFLTLFPSWRASVLSCIVQKAECYSLKAKPVFRKSQTELTAQHIGITQDVILSCNGEMSVHSVSVFAACAFWKSRLHTFLLYKSWEAQYLTDWWEICSTVPRGFKRCRDICASFDGELLFEMRSSSQEHFETKFVEQQFNCV